MSSLLGWIYLRRWFYLAGFLVILGTAVLATLIRFPRWLLGGLLALGVLLLLSQIVVSAYRRR